MRRTSEPARPRRFSGGGDGRVRSVGGMVFRVLAVPFLIALLCSETARNAAAQDAAVRTPQQLRAAFEQPVTLAWNHKSYREGVKRLASQLGTALVVDRRLDPDRAVQLTFRDLPQGQAWDQVAAANQAAAARVGGIVYLGPAETAAKLATVAALRADDAAKLKLPANAKAAWSRAGTLAWNDFATPEDILATLAREGGFAWDGLDRVPHDLWPAGKLPASPLPIKLTLVLGQFDLTYAYASPDGRKLRIEPLPEAPILSRRLPAGARPDERLRAWKKLAPQAELKLDGRWIDCRGRAEAIELLEDDAKGGVAVRPAVPKANEQRYTLKVEKKPLRPVLAVLCTQAGFELRLDEAAARAKGIDLSRPVSIDVKNETFSGLLSALLDGTGLIGRLEDKTLVVTPGE